MEFVAMNRKVRIDLKPGIYYFEPSAASGKTLLVKMIKSIGDIHKIALTYNDIILGINISDIIERKPELLVFDRFDMYDDKFQILENLKGTDSIVMVDYKTQRYFCDFDDICWITLTDKSLEVHDG